MLAIIYTLLLGLLCACFVECAIYAFCPSPSADRIKRSTMASGSPVDTLRMERENELYAEQLERHSIKHYLLSLLGSSLLACIALEMRSRLGVIADGILLGAVFTLGTGTIFGVTGGGRIAKFAVATASLAVCLGLGGLQFLGHR